MSPVIGVLLMVAITVILAAVIGTFVLGLGDSLNQAPQAQLDVTSDAPNSVNISHDGGDALVYDDITIQVAGSDNTSDFGDGEELAVGDTVGAEDDDWSNTVSVTITHDPSQSILLETEVEVAD